MRFRNKVLARWHVTSPSPGWSVILAVLAALGVAAWGTPVSAQTTPKPEIVEARVVGEVSRAVRVTVRSPKPAAGTLSCQCGHTSLRVDLPTGGEKTVWLPLDSSFSSFAPGRILWDLPGNNDPEFPVSSQIGNPALAVLPSALGSRSAPGSVSARGRVIVDVFQLSLDDIEQRPWLLGSFAILSTTAKEFSSLSGDGQRSVLGWVERGGELLIDDGGSVPGISQQPSDTRNALIGSGVVRRTANGVRTGQWESVLLPPTRSPEPSNSFSRSPISLKSAVKLAPGGALLAGLLVYALGVGPVAYMLGRRRRQPMLMWVAVPLTALVTTLGVLGIGLALRSTARDQFVAFRLQGALSDRVTIARAVVEGSKATRIRVPAGWAVDGDDVKVELGTVSTATVDLPPGGLSEVRFTGTTKPSAALVTAALKPDGTLTVTNVSSSPLRNVFAINRSAGQIGRVDIRDLAVGDSVDIPFVPTPSYSSTADEREREALAMMALDAGAFAQNRVVVIVEVEPKALSGVPTILTNSARAKREFVGTIATTNGPRISRLFQTDGTLTVVRVDVSPGSSYSFQSILPGDTVWIDGVETGIGDGPVPAGAIQNGAIVARSQNGTVTESAKSPESAGTSDGTSNGTSNGTSDGTSDTEFVQ